MPISTDPRVGGEFLGYAIEETLGRGGMGVVFRAHDARLNRDVALKLVAPQLSGDDRFRERFLRETELAISLEHPNVVPIYDAGEVDGRLYLAMRYVEGADLKTLLRDQEALERERAIAICAQLADALDAAHARGLVHRDVKPSNVLLDERGSVYLADFGLSRRLDDHGIPGDHGLSLGTPAYAAPEQIQGAEVDGRADVYSLGCLLYECLTGAPPFPRNSELAVLWAHLRAEPPDAAGYPTLAPVFAKALAKDPYERYRSCGDLVEAAREALGLREVAVTRRRWLALTAAGLALVPGVALIAVFVGRRGGRASRPSTQPTAAPKTDALQRIDPRTNKLVATFQLGSDPTGVAVGEGAVWTLHVDDNRIAKIDPATNEVVATGSAPRPKALAVGLGSVWIVTTDPTVTQLDAATGANIHDIPIPARLNPLELTAFGLGAVWVANQVTGLVARINPLSLEVSTPIDSGALKGALKGIAAGAGAVWVSTADVLADDYGVTRIDPATTRVAARIPLDLGAEGIDTHGGTVWVANNLGDSVSEIDAATNRLVRTIDVGGGPLAVAADKGAVWVTNYKDGTVSRIDPERGRLVGTIRVGPNPDHVAAGNGAVWVTVHPR